MMKQHLIILAFILFTLGLSAQQTMSLADAIIGNKTYLKPTMPEQIKWKDAQNFVMANDTNILIFNIKTNKQEKLLSLSDLNKILVEKGINRTNSIPEYTFINVSSIWFIASNHLIVLNLKDKSVITDLTFPEDAENQDFQANNLTLAFTEKNNLFICDKSGSQQITTDNEPHIINGAAVHRNEFGIEKGTFWSPTGKQLAFYHMDETMVGNYPLVDYMTREAELNNIKYPMAGMKSHEVKLGIYNLNTKQTVYMKTGLPADHYLTNICWSPDGKSIYIAELNRDQNDMKLNQYDASNGKLIKTVLEEKDEKYVEPVHPIVFSKNNPNLFFLQSKRDGWNHIYLYNTDGTLVTQITHGKWEVTNVLGTDMEDKFIYFEATKESPIERQLYCTNIKTGATEKITGISGTHAGLLSPDQQNMVDCWTSTNVPGEIDLISVKDNRTKIVYQAPNTLKNFELGENTVFTIKAADGITDMYCRLIKPNNFDPTKKYPVIVYVYGGPHAQLVNKTWLNDARWWQYYMATKGYIAFTVDSRGSDNRGKEFENIIYRQLGVVETSDQMKGIDYLKSLPYVDSTRIGVHGWSYGGFMTLNLILKHPETFKVGVAGGPVVDWSMYEVMYGERYMDSPEENPDGYTNANMLNYIENLKGKLMIIHGVQDHTVVMQQSMKFLKKCIDLEKQVDFFVYPTHEHNVRGKNRLHLMEKVSNYFLENL